MLSFQAESVGGALALRGTGNQENHIRAAKHAPWSAGSPIAPITPDSARLPANRDREKRGYKGETTEICEYCKSLLRGRLSEVPACVCAWKKKGKITSTSGFSSILSRKLAV